MLIGMTSGEYNSRVVNSALGYAKKVAQTARWRGILSSVGLRRDGVTGKDIWAFSARDVAVWTRRGGMSYTELMERCLILAQELEEIDGRTNEARIQ